METINEYAKLEGAQLNEAKEVLAWELTKLVHSEEEADKAQAAAKALFSGGADDSNMPTTVVSPSDFNENGEVTVLALMIKAGMIKSNGEGRRLIQQGGITVSDEKISEPFSTVTKSDFESRGSIIIKKGKKVFHKFTL
jgi:tyrosyl-tRNA synthetase